MPDATEALIGASAVFLNSRALGPELAQVASGLERHGVAKVVALSAINADDDDSRQPSRYRGDRNRECEQLAVSSGVPWVSLRPSVFASNFPGMWAVQIRAGDVVAGPCAEASTAPIAEADIAAVAAHALLISPRRRRHRSAPTSRIVSATSTGSRRSPSSVKEGSASTGRRRS